MTLAGKTILITGAARRIGRHLALTVASAGADVVLHHSNSPSEADQTAAEIEGLGRRVWVLQADFARPAEAEGLVARAAALSPLYALVNNAAIFDPLTLAQTTLADWQRTLDINLTAPFLLSRDFGAALPKGDNAHTVAHTVGRIVNIIDWRALRPGGDHFSYTISKAGLAAMTRSLAISSGPQYHGQCAGTRRDPAAERSRSRKPWRTRQPGTLAAAAPGTGWALGRAG